MNQEFKNFCRSPAVIFSTFVGFANTFFLTIKSWYTTTSFLLFFYAIFWVLKNPSFYFKNRSRTFWFLFICLVSPFFMELFAQIGRLSVMPKSLDGPSRWLLSGVIFVFLSRVNSEKIISVFVIGSGLGVLAVFISLLVFPNQYWGLRAGTYFVDPITLPCYVAAMAAIFLFGWSSDKYSWRENSLRLLVILMSCYVAIESSSRSSWLSLVGVLTFYLLLGIRGSRRAQYMFVICSLFLFLIIYTWPSKGSYSFAPRLHEAIRGVQLFVGDYSSEELDVVRSTSVGQRLIMGQVDVELIKRSPLFGNEELSIPPYEELKVFVPALNEEIHWIRNLAGSHTEFLAVCVRQGVIFGTWTLVSFFLVPLLIMHKASKSPFHEISPFFGIVLALFISSLGIQILNLKMTVTFYSLCLALFYAQVCYRTESQKVNKNSRVCL